MADLNVSLVVAAYGHDASAAAVDFQTVKGVDDAYVAAAVVLNNGLGRQGPGHRARRRAGCLGNHGGRGSRVRGRVVRPATAAGDRGRRGHRRRGRIHPEAARGESDRRRRPGVAPGGIVGDCRRGRRPIPRPHRQGAVGKATKKVTKAIDKGDYDAVVKAVNEGDEKIIEAAAT